MQIVTVPGVTMLIFVGLFRWISLIQKIIGTAQPEFVTVILIFLFSSSITIISLAIIGYYISRINEEIKDRP